MRRRFKGHTTRLCCTVRVAGGAPVATASELVLRRASAERRVALEACAGQQQRQTQQRLATRRQAYGVVRWLPLAVSVFLRRRAQSCSDRRSGSLPATETCAWHGSASGNGLLGGAARKNADSTAQLGAMRGLPGAEHRLSVIAVPFEHHRRASSPRLRALEGARARMAVPLQKQKTTLKRCRRHPLSRACL